MCWIRHLEEQHQFFSYALLAIICIVIVEKKVGLNHVKSQNKWEKIISIQRKILKTDYKKTFLGKKKLLFTNISSFTKAIT